MTYLKLLNTVIDDGLLAARRDYGKKTPRLLGAVAGFNECRERDLPSLWDAVAKARSRLSEIERRYANGEVNPEEVWYWRCYVGEVEWTFDCMNAAMMLCKMPHLNRSVPARCALKVHSIFEKEGVMAEGYDGRPRPQKRRNTPLPANPDLTCPSCKTTTIRFNKKAKSWECPICPWTEKALIRK